MREVTSYHFCHSLFARRESLGSAHTHGQRITQGEAEHQEVGPLWLPTMHRCVLLLLYCDEHLSSSYFGAHFPKLNTLSTAFEELQSS